RIVFLVQAPIERLTKQRKNTMRMAIFFKE
ncbi:MAG: hypothetical protein ACI9LN_001422, partial [Saprospiraceae bacterium]